MTRKLRISFFFTWLGNCLGLDQRNQKIPSLADLAAALPEI